MICLSPSLRASPVAAALALSAFVASRPAHAGPTVAADLDLGTSVGETGLPAKSLPPLYVAGFRIRAGWRFDIGPAWVVPEIGAGDDQVLHYTYSVAVPRVFGGGRAGVSFPLASQVAFEPGIYGHLGYAHVQNPPQPGNAVASDVGLSLDARVLRRIVVGAHVGYEVVTTWNRFFEFGFPGTPPTQITAAYALKWVGYGVHAGVLFW